MGRRITGFQSCFGVLVCQFQEQLEALNRTRKAKLDLQKTEVEKRRRVQSKRERVLDSQRRKEWSKAHGTLNKKRRVDVRDSQHDDVLPQESGDSDSDIRPIFGLSSDSSADESSDDWLHDNDLISGGLCLCGAMNRAHKSFCPMNSRNRSSRILFGGNSAVPVPSDSLNHITSDCAVKSEKRPSGKKDGDNVEFKPGDCVFVHSGKAVGSHIPCRVVQVVDKFYRLCSKKDVLDGRYTSQDLTVSSCDFSIPLDEWRQSPTVSLSDAIYDEACLESCKCSLGQPSMAPIDLTGDSAGAPFPT